MDGSTKQLQIDFANCFATRVGPGGVRRDGFEKDAQRLQQMIADLNQKRQQNPYRWRLLPEDPMRSEHLGSIQKLVGRYRGQVDNLIILGIGGSALGNLAMQTALNPPTHDLLDRDGRAGPRLFVMDNVDPHIFHHTIQFIQQSDPTWQRTLVNVISKSGETAETAAQFMIIRQLLEAARGRDASDAIIATTDPASGTLRATADAEGWQTLPIPAGVGGRFSVLSPVGLFSAAMGDIDVAQLLDGAAAMDERCQNPSAADNPAAVLAWTLLRHTAEGRANHVLMPYASQLVRFADWYRQLWAESLGKRHDLEGREIFAGATPVSALGATDQHSQIQLYREGPDDKVIAFVEVERFDTDVDIPLSADVESLQYLAGSSLGALLAAEKRATEFALVESQRPNLTIKLPSLSARHVGEFIQLWQVATAMAGWLLNINPFDQPAVETGKLATFGLMGRPGYEQWRSRVEQLETSGGF